MKYVLLMAVLLLWCYNNLFAQTTSPPLRAGIEVDVLPYATGGWMVAAWAGKDKWRLRALTATVKKPDITTKKGFSHHRIQAYALVADRFLQTEWKGWWLGGGLVLWNSTIQTDARLQTALFTNYLINGSAGYNLPLTKNLYLSPWAGMSVRAGGDQKVPVDNKHYTLPLLNPEASLKLGLWF
ncbi:MAG TPA: hypothetical protein VFV46_08600 [Lacibacter sp.]|nr:hypothetical protein [Lacibacter sp.]